MCKKLFKPKLPKVKEAPPPPSPSPAATNVPEVKEDADAERRRARRGGRAATILTGALGDTSAAPSVAKTLLGQ